MSRTRSPHVSVDYGGSQMIGECVRHDLQWFSGGDDCPACVLEAKLEELIEEKQRERKLAEDVTP